VKGEQVRICGIVLALFLLVSAFIVLGFPVAAGSNSWQGEQLAHSVLASEAKPPAPDSIGSSADVISLPPDILESFGTSCKDRVVHIRLSVYGDIAKQVMFDVVGEDCNIIFGPVETINRAEVLGSSESISGSGTQDIGIQVLRCQREKGTISPVGPPPYKYLHNSRTIQDFWSWDLAKLEGHNRWYYNYTYAWWEDSGYPGWAGVRAHDNDVNWRCDDCAVSYTDPSTTCGSNGPCASTRVDTTGHWTWSFPGCGSNKKTWMLTQSYGWYHGGGTGDSWTFGDWCPTLRHATAVWTSDSPWQ
jgi:hypothetical protein